MNISDATYRACTWLRHRLTAWNTGGENIHSPYLFEWVRMVMYDTHAYYVWADIEARRAAMLRAPKVIDYVDYGSRGSGAGVHRPQMVSDMARSSLEPSRYGQLLFRWVNWSGHQTRQEGLSGLNIVELGTNLGITSAYLASADSRDQVMTFEGCHDVAEMARFNWQKLGLTNIRCVEGNIDHTLQSEVPDDIDIAFIDANHTYDATLRYFDTLVKHLRGSKSVIVVDDIHYSSAMGRAWAEICKRKDVTCTMDIYKIGFVFFDPDYLHKHYKLRL